MHRRDQYDNLYRAWHGACRGRHLYYYLRCQFLSQKSHVSGLAAIWFVRMATLAGSSRRLVQDRAILRCCFLVLVRYIWDNLGGASDETDNLMVDTVCRVAG